MDLDYFLYDNVTLGRRSRDWGLKAATGSLADQPGLRADFEQYCALLPSDFGQLKQFDAALGGLAHGKGYLLCVVVESRDAFGRKSWVALGLWCPTLAVLREVLSEGDPVASARAVLGVDPPPKTLEVVASKRKFSRRASGEPPGQVRFQRFERGASPLEVISRLLAAIERGSKLPNIVAITAGSRLTDLLRMGFEWIYCHPLDARTEAAFESARSTPLLAVPETPQHRSSPEPVRPPVTETNQLPQSPSVPARPVRPNLPVPPPARRLALRAAAVVISIGVFLTGMGLWLTQRPRLAPAFNKKLLRVLGTENDDWKACKNQDLKTSWAFGTVASLPVAPEHEADRLRVQEAFAWLEKKRRIIENIKFLISKKAASSSGNQVQVENWLRELTSTPSPCETLAEAFRADFETGKSPSALCCKVLVRLVEVAKVLPKSGHSEEAIDPGTDREVPVAEPQANNITPTNGPPEAVGQSPKESAEAPRLDSPEHGEPAVGERQKPDDELKLPKNDDRPRTEPLRSSPDSSSADSREHRLLPVTSSHLGVDPLTTLRVPLEDVLEDGGALLAVEVRGVGPR
ncbi:MAG: hypothetical protein SF066_14805 [Thermoanaerobaculia bacterium]|nr:hypothetical protein [Thermoanaerobaculia bacterium]